jgi:hypothetical protein
MATKPAKIHYRKLRRDNTQFPRNFLSDRIKAALETDLPDGGEIRSRVTTRQADVPGLPDYRRLLNNFQTEDEWVFGTMCLFAPGQMQALLRLAQDDQQEELPLAKILEAFDIAEAQAPLGHEYLHGVSYFLVIGDHFYQIQTVSLQAKAMEEYFTWLLRDKTKVIAADNYVELQVEFDRAQVGDDELTSIQIGGLVPETMRVPESAAQPVMVDVVEHERLGDTQRATLATAKQIMIDLFGPMKTEEILAIVPPEAALEVTVNIGYRARKRRFQKAFMNEIATGLRNLPDGEIKARGRNGEIRGDDARLSQVMSIRRLSETSSLYELESARDQMLELHRRFLHDGKIA